MAAYNSDVGQRIRKAREGNRPDLSQEAAAHEVGVSVKQYGRWERGESVPRADKWQRLAEVLAVQVADLRGHPPVLSEHELGDQLDRIEAKLDAILAVLSPTGPAEVLEAEAARLAAQRKRSGATRSGSRRKAASS